MNTPNAPVTTPPTETINNHAAAFIAAIEVIQRGTHRINRDNGFFEEIDEIVKLHPKAKIHLALSRIALIQSEPSEATDAVRKHPEEKWDDLHKDTLVREMAGTVIRIMDFCEWLNLPLGQAIITELNENASRGYRHGGKAA